MNTTDRHHWDTRHGAAPPAPVGERFPYPILAGLEAHMPHRGHCLELACGQGRSAVWLALRGMTVHGVDISPVAIRQARALAAGAGVGDRCHFAVTDLDNGLPDTPGVDLLLCHNFRDPRLYGAMMARLAPGGLLAVATLSEVGAAPGRFRAQSGELRSAFTALTALDEGESSGRAWFLGQNRSPAEIAHEDNLPRG